MDPQLQSPSDSSGVPAEVSGWLLALCLILTIFFPVTSLYRIISHTIPTVIAAHTLNRILLLSVYSLVFSALAVLSFVSGLRLWLVKPHAVGLARRFLLTCLIANAAYFRTLFSGSQLFDPQSRLLTLRWDGITSWVRRRSFTFGAHIWNTPSACATPIRCHRR